MLKFWVSFIKSKKRIPSMNSVTIKFCSSKPKVYKKLGICLTILLIFIPALSITFNAGYCNKLTFVSFVF